VKEMGRALTFKQKEVINLADGRRLGYVQDVEANFETGEITAIIVPGSNKMFSFGNKTDIVIPLQNIKRIGDDIILVDTRNK
jgi:YlmC/YmxH family sporulation protein